MERYHVVWVVDAEADCYKVVDQEDGLVVFETADSSAESEFDANTVAADWNYANSFPVECFTEFDGSIA